MKRSKRDISVSNKRPFRLNRERDTQILWALYKMHLLRTSDITRLFFNSSITAYHRLRKLFDAGYVKTWVTQLHYENIYSLTRRGADYLANQYDIDDTAIFMPKGIHRMNLQHLFLLNTFRISLVLDIKKTENYELTFFKPEWELKKISSPSFGGIIPDALFGVRKNKKLENEIDVFALEVDCGNENLSYFMKTKVRRYISALHSGIFYTNIFKVIVFTENQHRFAQIKKVVKDSCESEFFVFLSSHQLLDSTYFKNIVLTIYRSQCTG